MILITINSIFLGFSILLHAPGLARARLMFTYGPIITNDSDIFSSTHVIVKSNISIL